MAFKLHKSGIVAAGLALFSMFFGAGDLIWPLILGGKMGSHTVPALCGFLVTAVSLPLLGLISMMLFQGDYRAFFNQTGRRVGFVLLFIIQMILGPFGSLPRLFTLAHATLAPYMPHVGLLLFSALASVLVLVLALKKNRIVDIIGVILAPVLILSLGAILILGFWHHPAPAPIDITNTNAVLTGLGTGYNTLDMIASFIFAPLVFSYFRQDEEEQDTVEARRHIFKKMTISCAIAGGLLALMFSGLMLLGAYYRHTLGDHLPEQSLGLIAIHLLGAKGALFSCLAIALSCLTTAIPIAAISGEYIQKEFIKKPVHPMIPIAIPLIVSVAIACLGFMGIASMLQPILQVLCPGLIILCILNIFHKLYEMKMRTLPIFAAFAISIVGYLVH
ncbi:MAG: branched-chain amino acid transport system II carrier protein [Chlamydiales bacterium]|nr:branched-chain amino acid transport system II carrier protein [Chlamydiales bacterium]